MSWVAVAIGGSAVLGAGASLFGANKQAKAAEQAAQVQREMFGQTQKNLAPWMQQGQMAMGELGQQFGGVGSPGNKPFSLADFQASPAYNFNLEQGMNAINKGAASRGNLYAPQTLQDLGKFSQGMASNEFQNAFSNYNTNQNNIFARLQTLSGSGQNAAAHLGSLGANTAGQIGNDLTGAGAARAGGIVGAANAISGGVGDYYNHMLMQQILAQQQQPMYGMNAGAGGGQIFGGS